MNAEDFGRVPDPTFRDRRSLERVPCLCGHDVTRAPFESVTSAVQRHNRLPAHRRMTAGWEAARVRREAVA